MSHPLEHPKAIELLQRVSQYFQSEDTYILPDSRIVFVCGGNSNENDMRPQFCKYASEHLSHFRIFLAEKALNDYWQHPEPEFQNLADFEDIIAELSTCVVMFPESPGSFAELGYFARSDTLRKKMLVVNNACYQSQDSFIALGPINLIDQYSDFKPTVQLAYSGSPEFKLVEDRLNMRIPHFKNRKKLKAKIYLEMTIEQKFYTVFEIIRIFQALTAEGVIFAFQKIWGEANPPELLRLLSILVAADYIKRGGEESNYFCINRAIRSFLEFKSHDLDKVIFEVIDLYEESFFEPAQIVRSLGG